MGGAVEGPHGIEESGCTGTSRFPPGLGRFLWEMGTVVPRMLEDPVRWPH